MIACNGKIPEVFSSIKPKQKQAFLGPSCHLLPHTVSCSLTDSLPPALVRPPLAAVALLASRTPLRTGRQGTGKQVRTPTPARRGRRRRRPWRSCGTRRRRARPTPPPSATPTPPPRRPRSSPPPPPAAAAAGAATATATTARTPTARPLSSRTNTTSASTC